MEIILIKIFLVILALVASFMFSGAETAIASLDYKGILGGFIARNKSEKRIIFIWRKSPWRILNAIVIWNNICGIFISIMAINFSRFYADVWGMAASELAFLFSCFAILLVFVFGDMLPKIFARLNPGKFFSKTTRLLLFFERIILPINILFSRQLFWVTEFFGVDLSKAKEKITEEDAKEFLDIGEADGTINHREKDVLKSIIDFEDLMVNDVMVPRAKMDCVDVTEDLEELVVKASKLKHSILPVYEGEFDNIIGLLYTKDFLMWKENKELITFKDMLSPAYFIPPTKKVHALLNEFREGKYHLAVVVDEYGVVQGMVTIEDLVEEIVGEILDEYDVDEGAMIATGHGVLVSPDMELDVLDEKFGLDLEENTPDEVRTVSGYIMFVLGRIPEKGEIVRAGQMMFWIKDVDKRAIKELVITRVR